MSREAFATILAAFLRRRPFSPFTLELINSTKLEVLHPEALTMYDNFFAYMSTRSVRSFMDYGAALRFIDTTGA